MNPTIVTLREIAENLPCSYGEDLGINELTAPVVKVSNIDSVGEFHKSFEERSFTKKELQRLLVKEGELLVVKSSGSKTNVLSGKTAICTTELANKIVASNFVMRIKPNPNKVDSRYLWRYLNSSNSKEFVKKVVGTTTYPNLRWETYSEHPIPLPPLDEQRRIASILDKADAIRRKRQESIRLTEEFLRSTFLEMFGDPVTNPKRWEVKQLADVVAPGRIVTYGIVQAGPHIEDGVPYIRTGDIQNGKIKTEGLQRTCKEIAQSYKRSEVNVGDLVMSIRATVGTIAELPEELNGANLTQGTARISPGPNALKSYLLWAIRSKASQDWIQKQVKGATFKEITLGKLRELPILVPPLNLQRKFCEISQRCNDLNIRLNDQIEEAGVFFNSLTHRAFRGEL